MQCTTNKYNKILVVGGKSYRSYGTVVSHLGEVTYDEYITMEDFKKLSLIMFTGGEDVHPSYYGGTHNNVSFCNKQRDSIEENIFKHALKYNIKMTGICRGFQFLNVMCGGEMYQHIENHAGRLHNVVFPAIGKTAEVTSTHHQLVKPHWNNALPVAWSEENRSTTYIGPDCQPAEPPDKEIEALVFPDFNVFGVQFHPEMMGSMEYGRQLYTELIDKFFNESMEFFVENYASEVKNVRRAGTKN